MAAQNFKEEDWGNGDTKLGQNWHKNFQACMSSRAESGHYRQYIRKRLQIKLNILVWTVH